MEANSLLLLRDGREIKLPVGFRFRPTDQELIVDYLKRKVLSVPLPALVIPELDNVFGTDPWRLPGNLRERRHFFCRRGALKGSSSLRSKCNDGSGYWKLTGKEKRVVTPGSSRVIGVRRNLAFYQGSYLDITAPQWIMHELRLLSNGTDAPDFTASQGVEKRGGEWAVYRVFQRRRKHFNLRKDNRSIVSVPREITSTPTVIDFANDAEAMRVAAVGSESDLLPPPPPSPCLSSST
ncbi:hypothetical protein SAY86_016096 [Trapa natans]|uniref:NAC domain-containing protein n=1 Tax=Trapa natans TaxID=22666 RepID=A0AAN7LD32_TRANT|nr:hypothetical protein SAY86_016096 [Trapa natans]